MKTMGKTNGDTAGGQGHRRVFLKRDKAGGWRANWYGRFMRNGKTRETSLCKWAGTPPQDGAAEGDAAFERSRERASKMLADVMGGRNEADDEIRDARKVYRLMYGQRVDRVKVADLWTRWNALPHKAGLSEGWRELVHCVLKRFADFMAERFPAVTECGALLPVHFEMFFAYVDGLGLSGRAWNYHLSILRSVLKKVDGGSVGFRDYLAPLQPRKENTIHRRPFTGDELEAIFTAAATVDPELRPVLIAAASTGLRRGDVATLKWDAVDMAEGFIAVKTQKTDEDVSIPIFPPLRTVLQDAAKTRRAGVPYVFPRVALAYKAGPGALDRRLNKVLLAAGFTRPAKPCDAERRGRGGNAYKYPALPPEDALAMCEAGMKARRWTDRRREKGLEILRRHLDGEDGRTIARKMRVGASSVSEYLHALEAVGEVALVSPAKADPTAKLTLADARDGEQRQRRGSLAGWHGFRTSFCTLALQNGVPMEILKKVTGHRTAEIVLKYYDRRGREAIRKAFGAAMPKAIAGAVEGAEPAKPRADGEELVAVPATLAGLLADADAAALAEVAEVLKRKGGAK